MVCKLILGDVLPKMVRYPSPPLVLGFAQTHLCDTPLCDIHRAIKLCDAPHKNKDNHGVLQLAAQTLKTLTSLNKKVRPFFLGDNSIWSFPLCLPLAITAFGGSQGSLSLAIVAFGAFQFIVPKFFHLLGKMEFKESSLLI